MDNGYIKQTEKEIREAYIFLREKNHSIPSETLQFMLDASLEKLRQKANQKKMLIAMMREDENDGFYD